MKNVIAYSLWGDNPLYWKGAQANIEQAKIYFPDWICRFYIDKAANKDRINAIQDYDTVEVILMDAKDSFHGMFWRFLAAADLDVNIMLSRDCDSRFSIREVTAVKEWLASDKDFHIMRDHPRHCMPILGGMWGCRNGILRADKIDIVGMMNNWTKYSSYSCDQDFLALNIYPLLKGKAVEHSEFNLPLLNEIIPFSTERVDYEFVGDTFDENNIRHPLYWQLIQHAKQ